MGTMKRLLWNMALVSLLVVMPGCGDNGDEEGGKSENERTFKLTSSDLNCSSDDITVNVPYAGRTYTLKVNTSAEISWSVSVESGDLVTVTPTGEQKGDGEIQITAIANPSEIPGKKGVVIIKNSANNKTQKIYFTQAVKELYIPNGTENQTTEEFNSPNSKFNVHCMMESDNVAVLWDRAFSTNPLSDPIRPFDPEELLEVGEEVYAYLRNELKFASVANSCADKYKLIIFMRYDDDGGAGGAGRDDVGMLWISPNHMDEPKHNVVYHEMSHSFQYIANFDGGVRFGGTGSFYEMTSQWTLLRRYPDWIDLEYSHFKDFMLRTHLTLGHNENQYHSPYVLEYWADKHGVGVISEIWQKAIEADQKNFMLAYQRITNTSQEKFNEEIYDAATKFITWDLKHIEAAYKVRGANVHTCELNQYGNAYAITTARCPQNYGYNGIKLKVPASNTTVTINFEGLTAASDFIIQQPERAEWRYGFLAVKTDGTRVYGDMNKVNADSRTGTASFTVPEGTAHLWLVVAATPTIYWYSEDNQWPYEFSLDGTEPDGDKCKVTRK